MNQNTYKTNSRNSIGGAILQQYSFRSILEPKIAASSRSKQQGNATNFASVFVDLAVAAHYPLMFFSITDALLPPNTDCSWRALFGTVQQRPYGQWPHDSPHFKSSPILPGHPFGLTPAERCKRTDILPHLKANVVRTNCWMTHAPSLYWQVLWCKVPFGKTFQSTFPFNSNTSNLSIM